MVYLIGVTDLLINYLEAFKQRFGYKFESDAATPQEELIEVAGRICYHSFEKMRPAAPGLTINETYIRHIVDVGHESVFEHVVFNWLIDGMDRCVSHELVRHRVGTAFSQTSTRYVPPIGNVLRSEFNQEESQLVSEAFQMLDKTYDTISKSLESRGITGKRQREICATILPNATETNMIFSVNLRELRHIFKLRCSPAANASIREVCLQMYDIVRSQWPNLLYGVDIERNQTTQ